ncbi:MAG: toprim domain-containing protein [Saprospiraceae bacterium]|nr:toprim domain-containing protein [Saprospiraceae bacterium]
MEISEIKTRLTLAQVLHYYHLKPDKNLRLCCPFHDDKTPSLQLYYKTHTAYCFSSNCKTHGKSMDVIDFIMNKENCTKHEALKKATEMITGEGLKAAPPADRLTTLHKIFTYFKNGVVNSQPAKAYIQKRHLNTDAIDIGFNSGQFHYKQNDAAEAMQEYLNIGLLLELGVMSRFGKPAYKPFGKHCIVFALRDQEKRVVSLYFRSMSDDKSQRHFYLKDRQGLYPKYPRENTQKLIITESIIDAATIFQLHLDNVDNQITTVLALYGTNGWTDEHTTAIQALPELNEIIFFLNGDEAGQKAVQKYAPMMKSTYPKVKVSNVEVPHNEDVNSLLDSHSEEIIIHLIKERKEIDFLFSTEKSNENKKTEQAENPVIAQQEVEVNTVTSTPEEKRKSSQNKRSRHPKSLQPEICQRSGELSNQRLQNRSDGQPKDNLTNSVKLTSPCKVSR